MIVSNVKINGLLFWQLVIKYKKHKFTSGINKKWRKWIVSSSILHIQKQSYIFYFIF